ncbi:MAG: Kelch repeat-containing protein [Gemmatimonadales bacterium]
MTAGDFRLHREGGTFAALALTVLVGCSGGNNSVTPPPPPAVASVSVTPDSPSLQVGATLQLSATLLDASGHRIINHVVSWSTSNATVTSVSDSGLVTALASGTATITATSEGKRGRALVTVAPLLYTLSVSVRPGVAGSPSAGEQQVLAGTTVQYAFTPRSGYQNLSVRADSTTISASGQLVVTKDVTLTATADTILTANATTTPLISALRSIITDPSPMAGYRQLQALTDAMFNTLPAAEAQRQLQAARALAYSGATDAGALQRAMIQLGDSLQAADLLPSPSARRANSAAPVVPTTFIYVNGIATDPTQASATISNYLTPLISEAGYQDRTAFPVRRSYNNSGVNVQSGLTFTCIVNVAASLAVGVWSTAQQLASCFGIIADVGESARQVISQTVLTLPPTADDNHLVQIVQSVLAGGSRVVIIAHSQGNLVAADALKILAQTTPATRLECIGIVSIAPPLLIQQGPGGASVSSMIIQGVTSEDILRVILLGNGVPPITNELSDAWDTEAPLSGIELILSGVDLHSINDSYVTENRTRTAIKQAVTNQVEQVGQRCPDLAPPPAPSIAPSPQSISFAATAAGAIPAAKTVAITNGGAGTLTGLAVGTVTYQPGETGGWLGTPTLSSSTDPSTLMIRPNTTGLANGTYHATVAITATGNVSNSPIGINVTYVVSTLSLLPAPTLSGPSDGATGISTTPTFTWSAVPGATNYWLVIASNPSVLPTDANAITCSQCVMAGFTTTNSHTLPDPFINSNGGPPAGTLNPGTTYYWQVQAFTAGTPITEGAYSATSHFTTAIAQQPTIGLSSQTATFNATAGGSNPPSQNAILITDGIPGTLAGITAGPINYQGPNTGWLVASPSSTTTPANLNLSVTTGSLPAGTYTATVPINSTTLGVTNNGILVTVSFVVGQAIALPKWDTIAPLPNPIEGAVAVSVGDLIYLIGGNSNPFGCCTTGSMSMFDPTTGSWSLKAAPPADFHAGFLPQGASTLNNMIYVPGGGGLLGPVGQLFIYDPSTDKWTIGADLPPAIAMGNGGPSASLGGKLYVLGGPQSEASNAFYAYDPASAEWAQLPSPPHGHWFGGFAAIGAKLYAVGGQEGDPDGYAFNVELDVFDPSTGSWTTGAPLPAALIGGAAVSNGLLAFIGSHDSSPPSDEIAYIYNPSSDTWQTVTDTNFPSQVNYASYTAAVAASHGFVYAFGGLYFGFPTARIERLNLAGFVSNSLRAYRR